MVKVVRFTSEYARVNRIAVPCLMFHFILFFSRIIAALSAQRGGTSRARPSCFGAGGVI